tara:strand:+ start:64 stop:360 length:297 start_codon:yes stop_codon:yes gene_type:complete
MIINRTKEVFNNGRFDCYLSDDGTLDTIIEINKIETHNKKDYSLREFVRINSYDAQVYRSDDGTINETNFKRLCSEYLNMFTFNHEVVLNDLNIEVIK